MADSYDWQGWLPPDLAPTQPIWSQPNNMPNVPNVNQFWDKNTPVGKWNMTSFNYDQWAPIRTGERHEPARFCALNTKDFDIVPGEAWLHGQHGDLFPHCYVQQNDILNNQHFFKAAQQAQTEYAAGKYDAVSEINREDPFALEPCANNRSLFASIAPIAGAVLAAVGTGIVISYAMPDDAPQALKSISVLGALAFGFAVGSAIAEPDTRARRDLFKTSSMILGTAAGADAALIGAYIAIPGWQDHEYIWVVAGGGVGYFLISPTILPYVDNYLTGAVGFVFRLVDSVTSLFSNVACEIGNWDIDGCTRETNPDARSWDRVLLATALVDEMAKKNDMDEKEREVAFQALLLNAASWNTWQDSYNVANQVMSFDNERSWNGPTYQPAAHDFNAYSAFGPVVQANTTNDPAWYDKLSGAANYEYYWTMFTKDQTAPLLQRCAPLRTLIGDIKMQEWMDDAYKLAKQGKMQPYPVTVPKSTFSCEVAYLRCMQEPTEGAAYELARVLTQNYADIFANCRKDPAKLKFVVWWEVFLLWREPATGAQRVIAENFQLTQSQDPIDLLKHQELIAGVVAIFRHFKLDTTIGDNVQAQEIWRFWLYAASPNRKTPIPLLPTKCTEEIYEIERGNPTYAELGRRAAHFGGNIPASCDLRQTSEISAFKLFDKIPCDWAVANGKVAFDRTPNKVGECGFGNAFLQASDFKTQCSLESQDQVAQWVAACSQ